MFTIFEPKVSDLSLRPDLSPFMKPAPGDVENTSARAPNEKRCYDIRLSRQEGSTRRHLGSAQYWDRPASGNTRRLFLAFGGSVCADQISNCPLDRMY